MDMQWKDHGLDFERTVVLTTSNAPRHGYTTEIDGAVVLVFY